MIPNNTILKYLTKLALNNEGVRGKWRLAAGIVHKGNLIATGVNSMKSDPIMLRYGKNSESIYLHAEVSAIKNALRMVEPAQLTKCDLYVVRVKRDGSYGLAMPCSGCARAISEFGLRNVYWTT